MQIILEKILEADDLHRVRSLLASEQFVDGRSTSTLTGKNNLQLPPGSQASRDAGTLILERLAEHPTFQLGVHPRSILPPLFSKYEVGMSYPEHVDSAIMEGCRTDLAMTLFLSDLHSYSGGELVVDTGNGTRRYRLKAGDAIVYPATTLHYVAPVVSGARLVAVTWAQSMIRDSSKRQILYDLSSAIATLGDGPYVARLRCSYNNLLRLWAEV